MLHRVQDAASGVHGHTIEFVRESLSVLRDSGARFISLRQLVEDWRAGQPIDPNSVAFTIDDGFADQAELVRAAFAPLRCPVTVFLITGFLDGQLWPWDDQLAFAFRNATVSAVDIAVGDRQFALELGSPASRMKALHLVRDYCKTVPGLDYYATARQIANSLGTSIPRDPPPWFRPMSWDTARALEREGLCEFGPHSVTHAIFSRTPDDRAITELNTSWRRLKEELGHPVPVFAWPTGRREDFSDRDVRFARQAGLSASVSTDSDYAFHGSRTGTPCIAWRAFPFPRI
jgi:peptidoglycan/xylan/chitin deacetylase (PgdA/CDA1 family)